MEMAERARQNRIYFFIKDYLGVRDGRLLGHFKYPRGLDGKTKKCECRSNELLIAPDLQVYKCHRDLYHAESPLGSLLEKDYKIDNGFKSCDRYGQCNPCDLKLKANRFLEAGNCSVEIRE
jgi:radical SAM protein with 4Fe4S-binding SPASM domain